MKILLDAMGGDNAPKSTVQGAADAVKEFGDGMTLALLGDEAKIKAAAQELGVDLTPFELIHCTEDVDMHDDPVKAVRHKTDSSLVKGLTMLKNGEADAFVSAGSTGALHVGTSLIVRTVKGVKRPALATCMPGKKQPFLLLDCGANAECRAEMLNAFGTMGSVYMNKVMGRKDPAVALVNNGTEDTKGTPMYREAHGLLKANPAIRFVGNIEPRDIMAGEVDVIVCDGFVGNVVLKLTENQQAAIMEAGADTQAFNADLSETAENKVLDELKSSGCNVVDVPDKAPWQEACQKVISENTSDQAELYQQLLDMKA